MRRVVSVAVVCLVAAAAVALGAAPAGAQPVRERQWYLGALDIARAHGLSTGAGVVVGVVDTGVAAHPDLEGQVLPGTTFVGRSDGREDFAGHGTGVAGLIAAKGGGPDRALGVAPGAKILPVQVAVRTEGVPGFSRIAPGIRWAADNGATVINVSMAGRLPPEDVEAVRYALSRDVVIVAAAGNVAGATPGPPRIEPPASYPGVIAVTATDHNGNLWSGSARGPEAVLAAPGVDMIVVQPALRGQPPGYTVVPGGTSASAPLVAGAAALIRARFPQLKAPDVIQRLIRTADDAGPPGRDEQYGFGRLNLVRALTADVPAATANPLGEPTASTSPVVAADRGLRVGNVITAAAVASGGCLLATLIAAGVVAFVVLRRRRTRPG